MKRLSPWCIVLALIAFTQVASSRDQEKKPMKDRLIVLIDATTKGIVEGTKIKEIDVPEKGVKRTLTDAKTKGKDQPRLVGIYVVKNCTITLADGKRLEDREVWVAIEVGKQTLRDFKYVESCEAKSENGAGKWYGYTAEYELKQ